MWELSETQSQNEVTVVHLQLSKQGNDGPKRLFSILSRTCFEWRQAMSSKKHKWKLIISFLTCAASLKLMLKMMTKREDSCNSYSFGSLITHQ